MLFLCVDRYRIFILQQLLLHSILEIRILHRQQDACAAGGEVQAALQIAGVRLTQGPSQESSMVLPCVKLPLAMTTSSV